MNALWRIVERNMYNFPNQTALRYPAGDRTFSWQELYDQSWELSWALAKQGLGKGGKVGILSPNKPEFILAFLAASALGATAVPINVRLAPPEIDFIAQDANIGMLLFDSSAQEQVEKLSGQYVLLDIKKALASHKDNLTTTVEGIFTSQDFVSESANIDVAEILYTSGTTGKPKGVMLSSDSVIAVAQMMAYEADIRPRDNVLLLMPLTHSAPLNLFMWGAFWAGASVTIGDFTPGNLLNYVSRERATHFFGAPVVYQLLLRVPELAACDLSSMKTWIYGGASVGGEQIRKWQELLPGRWMGVYGLTEAGPNGAALRHEEHEAKRGSIGNRGAINAALRVVRADGTETECDEPGEIIIYSASTMLGYHNNSEATVEALRDGWLYTGDIGCRDADGYIWILDRKKDMIISGGVNIYPKEIEDVLLQHPDVLDVAVIGVPHPDWGETVLANIVIKPGSQLDTGDIQEFCRGKLADYKIPRVVQQAEALPRNASGKLLKHVLR